MKRNQRSPEQAIRMLAEADKLLGQGQGIEEVCRHLEIAESTITAGGTNTPGENASERGPLSHRRVSSRARDQ